MSCVACRAGYTRCDCPPPVTTDGAPASTPAATPVARCLCGKRATVSVRLLPRPSPLFGGAVTVETCPSCYAETVKRGRVLDVVGIGETAVRTVQP